jgi:putative oxidoreductase
VRRLFFTFAHGPPGIGLLLLRLLTGTAVVAHSVTVLRGEPPVGLALFAVFLIGLGLLLIAGFWTPVVAASIAVIALWDAFAHAVDRWYFVTVAILGIALTLLGPGAWSVDARLFGWKRLEICDRKEHDSSR